MATVSAIIFAPDQKQDGTWNVKIRVSSKSKHAFIETKHFVGKNQVKKKGKGLVLKDTYVIDRVAPQLKKYRDWISDHSEIINGLDAKQIKEKLVNIGSQNSNVIEFFSFCEEIISEKESVGKGTSAANLQTVLNSLRDYVKDDQLPISNINYSFLKKYSEFLRKPRIMDRKGSIGQIVKISTNGVSDAGLHNHMRDLRLLFNEARNKYNDEDQGIILIPHYPFKKFKVGVPPLTVHRDREVLEIVKIRDADLPAGSRVEKARDLAMLSFYMCGMNAADLYELKPYNGASRINYNRAKTRGKRRDKAFISVKVVDQAKPLLRKYAGQLQKQYSTREGLDSAISKGMRKLGEITEIESLQFYDFRHCVGSWARNICGLPKDDVAMALNQNERTVTDIYISPDWSIVDRVQSGVVKLLIDFDSVTSQ